MMECKCVRCVNDVRTSHTRMQTENLKKNSMHQLSISQEKNKENRFASAKVEEKTTWWKERWTRIGALFIVSVRFSKEWEWECFCRHSSTFELDRKFHAASATVREKTIQTQTTLIQKMELVKISFLILEKLPQHKQMKGSKGRKIKESAYRKVKSIRARFVCHSAMISIMIEHSNFRKFVWRISFYLLNDRVGDSRSPSFSLRSRQLFSHLRFGNGSFSRWFSFTAVSHYLPSILALTVSHSLLSISCRCVFFRWFSVDGNRAKCSSLILIYCYLDAETF